MIFMCLVSAVFAYSQRYGRVLVGGEQCEYDTVIHRHVAPGAMYTQYHFDRIRDGFYYSTMTVHVIEVDVTNPYNSFSPYISKDQYYVASKQTHDIRYRKEKGLKPVASMMGSAFVQTNGEGAYRKANEVVGKVVSDKEIIYEESWNSRTFYMDDLAHIGNLVFKASVINGDNSCPITMVNHHRDHAGQNIALFCNGVPSSLSSSSTLSNGVDVRVRLKDNNIIGAGQTTCEVIEKMNGCGHAVGNGEAILSGIGNAATFLNTLVPGTEVVIDVKYMDEQGASIALTQGIEKFFAFGVKEGVVIPTDQKDYAICAIGCSKDGKKLYMADLENSPRSRASVQRFLEFMQQIGVYNLLPLDGGPSAEMTLDEEFISISSVPGFEGRYVPNGAILYSVAPDDDKIASIECTNGYGVNLKYGETFVPMLYAFNQYDEMILADAKNSGQVKITCSANIGRIADDGYTFVAEGGGDGVLTVEVPESEFKMTIPVFVEDNCSLEIVPHYFFTKTGRGCQLKVMYTKNGVKEELNPADVEWSVNYSQIIKGWKNGYIEPAKDGLAEVYAQYNGIFDIMNVEVENIPAGATYRDLTGALYYSDVDSVRLPSVPLSFTIALKARRAGNITLNYLTGSEAHSIESGDLDVGEIWNCHVTLKEGDLDSYPVTLVSIAGSANPSALKLYSYYVDGINGDLDGNGFFDVDDIVALLRAYLGEVELDLKTADIDDDGAITVSDISAIISMYLNK